MESYHNKLFNSEFIGSKLSMTSLNSVQPNLFQKLIQYMREKYNERLQRLENASQEFKDHVKKDPALMVMKENLITEKYIDLRISELFQSALFAENEKTIGILQEELLEKKSEIIKLENKIYLMKLDHEKIEDNLRSTSRDRLGHVLNKDFYERLEIKGSEVIEKKKYEDLEKEMNQMKKELNKTREIFEENQKLQRYCEQLENEREKMHSSFTSSNNVKTMMEAQKLAGFETIKEIQNKFKQKIKALKKKIIDQKGIIENFESHNSGTKRITEGNKNQDMIINEIQKNFEKKELEINEKYKQQINNLQIHYKSLLDSKIQEIQEQIDPKTVKSVPQEQYFEVCKQKNDLENELIQLKNILRDNLNANDLRNTLEQYEQKNRELENSLFILKTEKDIKEMRTKAPFNEKYEAEVKNHAETKFKLKLAEENLLEVKNYLNDIEANNKILKENSGAKEKEIAKLKLSNEIHKLNYSKISKLKNFTAMMKSQNKNLKIYTTESMNTIFHDYFIQLKETLLKISGKIVNENKMLTEKLKFNSVAFDKLQEEVKQESSKMKLKHRVIVESSLRESKLKYEKEIDELKEESKKYKELFEKTSNSLHSDTQSNLILRSEIQQLKEEKEKSRSKLKTLEEKIETQTSNFKNQLKNKQIEIEMLKKKINN